MFAAETKPRIAVSKPNIAAVKAPVNWLIGPSPSCELPINSANLPVAIVIEALN